MKKINVLAVIPIREKNLKLPASLKKLRGKPLVDYTIFHAKSSKYINKIIVSTNSGKVINHVRKLGIDIPFKRPKYLDGRNIVLDDVLRYTTKWVIDNTNFSPGLIVLLEITHPFRKPSLIDQAIEALIKKNLDTVFVSYEDHRNYWRVMPDNTLERIGEEGYKPREKHLPIYREVSGVACVTKPDFILNGSRLGEKVGMIPVRDARVVFDLHDEGEILF